MFASDRQVVSCRFGSGEAIPAPVAGVDFTTPRSGELACALFVNILFVLSFTVFLFVLKPPLRLRLAGQGIKGEGTPREGQSDTW